jgi:murein DD-endopeptidase MepM/ murein hydrolase activator NlpD
LKLDRSIWALLVFPSLLLLALFFFYGCVVDRPPVLLMPVMNADRGSYDQHSFGAPRNGHTHKGVDIFAKKGTPVISASDGIVIFTGNLSLGGKVVTILSYDFKFYYYAHLDTILIKKHKMVFSGDLIGKVGNTGNAFHTPSHLHFSICRFSPQKKFFNPVPLLNKCFD